MGEFELDDVSVRRIASVIALRAVEDIARGARIVRLVNSGVISRRVGEQALRYLEVPQAVSFFDEKDGLWSLIRTALDVEAISPRFESDLALCRIAVEEWQMNAEEEVTEALAPGNSQDRADS